jgi:hypothetical protein
MNIPVSVRLVRAFLCPLLIIGTIAHAQSNPASPALISKMAPMTMRATGTFEVKLAPLAAYNSMEGANAGRMSIDKIFRGDLEATSKGEMLTAGTVVKGSAGYVAIERVTGMLNGKSGGFALQHSGTMNRGAPQLSITVVPDSGDGQLTGIAGRMNIIIADGKHTYEFDYTLGEAP